MNQGFALSRGIQIQRVLRWSQQRLADRRWPLWAALIATLLTLPTLGAGYYFDDLGQRLRVEGFEGLPPATPWNLFVFLSGEPAERELMLSRGFLPWFTSEHLKIAFWRPLASLSHYLDYRFMPERPGLMHLQNVLWYGLLAWLLARLYRRLLEPGWVAGLAALLYIVDDAHGITVGWICNRNSMMAAVFGVLVVHAHTRWREEKSSRQLCLGLMWLVIGLLTAEATVAALAYVLAYALCLDQGSWRDRLATLLPYGGVVLVWRTLYQMQGAGAYGGDGYLDPGREPLFFLAALPLRAVQYLQAQLAWPPTALLPGSQEASATWLLVGSVLFLLLVGWVLRPLLQTRASSRFWALGMLLAVVPICAARPQDRNLFFVGFGAMALVAQLLGALLEPVETAQVSRSWRLVARGVGLTWVLIHLVVAPLSLPIAARVLTQIRETARLIRTEALLPSTLAGKTLLLTSVPTPFAAGIFSAPTEERPQVPQRALALAVGRASVLLRRTGPQTLVVVPEGGFLADELSRGFRPDRHPLALGAQVALPDALVEVTALTPAGRPAEATFHFHQPLEHESLVWLSWTGLRYEPLVLPEVGQTVTVPPVDYKQVFLALRKRPSSP